MAGKLEDGSQRARARGEVERPDPRGNPGKRVARWQQRGAGQELAVALGRAARLKAGREPQPSVALIDRQSVKSAAAGEARGFHGGKELKARSRHLVTDTGGRVLAGRGRAANRAGPPPAGPTLAAGQGALRQAGSRGGRRGLPGPGRGGRRHPGHAPAGGPKKEAQEGFQLLPRRRVTERTFAWLGRFRPLSKDYERRTPHAQAFLWIAGGFILLKPLRKVV